ncbi:MAG: L-fucose mutarotase [Opitutales bacterium]|jgi:L-fucose mutarotase|nr:L-fucose mutarotase [Opitutales bacterium]MDG2254040.1 L-fucose mutarotase [Opitutaceae bacterium]MBT5167219.1 L-fucose mutarotase [Opitutales bacterium]MBT5812974.1 L-fucose mutarotase [Opitutales bacterium]MBT6379648.1 L-fucose mutarotase [Opitutales bacterium]
MLIGISPLLSPELLNALYCMGHGDEIVLADAHFPGDSTNPNCIRADGLKIADLLSGIAPLFILDQYVENPLTMMAPVDRDQLDPSVESSFLKAIRTTWPETKPPERVERFDFYDRSQTAFAVVMTGDTAQYGNIILKKGVTPC